MTIMWGNVNKYLGMTIDYSSTVKLILLMVDYIGNMLYDIPEYKKGESSTPASHHLFDIAEYTTKLSQTEADSFHHFVAQLIYLSKMSCPDIHMAVPFLCTRVV